MLLLYFHASVTLNRFVFIEHLHVIIVQIFTECNYLHNLLQQILTLDKCVSHLIIRGLVRISLIQHMERILNYLTAKGFINYGILENTSQIQFPITSKPFSVCKRYYLFSCTIYFPVQRSFKVQMFYVSYEISLESSCHCYRCRNVRARCSETVA